MDLLGLLLKMKTLPVALHAFASIRLTAHTPHKKANIFFFFKLAPNFLPKETEVSQSYEFLYL